MRHRIAPRARQLLEVFQVTAALTLLALIAALLAGIVPSIAGYEAYVVYSGSMEPAIAAGDLAVVAPVRAEELRVGDVITYRTPQRPDVIVTHRLVDIQHDDDGRLSFHTKGDANQSIDQVAVDQGSVLGRVAYAVPKIGYLVDFSRRAEGKVLLIALPGLLLGVDYLLGVRRRRRAQVASVRGEAGQLLARGRVALQNGGTAAAMALFNQAIALDPHLDEAWLLKAECLSDRRERLACLRAGLTVNPHSSKLREAVEHATAAEAEAG